MLIIEKYYPDWKSRDIHESSPGNRGVSIKLKNQCTSYIASQYYPDKERGVLTNGFRNEDLENQTFKDCSFDLVITQDVMEHVYNPSKAFCEIGRTLKSGGAYIFTVPLINKFKASEKWAKKSKDGSPIFLKEPEYHDNPVDPRGSPVTMHWGYDIVDFIQRESGMHSVIEYIDDLKYGIRAEFIEIIVSRKE
jgi:SAM-dependent methyltransferase